MGAWDQGTRQVTLGIATHGLIPLVFDIFLGLRVVGYGTVYLWLCFWLEFLPNRIAVMRVRLEQYCGLIRICTSPEFTHRIATITIKRLQLSSLTD